MSKSFVMFLMVGVVAALAYTATVAVLIDGLGWGVIPAFATAFGVGTLVSYFGNARFSFDQKPQAHSAVKFTIVTAFGFVLNLLLAALLTRFGLHHLLVSLIIFVVIPPLNYLGHRLWSFRDPMP